MFEFPDYERGEHRRGSTYIVAPPDSSIRSTSHLYTFTSANTNHLRGTISHGKDYNWLGASLR